MKISVLGTGLVGTTIGTRLVQIGHDVWMGSRTAYNESADMWVAEMHGRAARGTYAEAAEFGDMVFNCTRGVESLAALETAGAKNLEGKILVDVANPLDYTHGAPPRLVNWNCRSLGEEIQRVFPKTRVVKTLNTVSANLMVHPEHVPGEHAIFVSGNDKIAKLLVASLLQEGFGWRHIIDLGDIKTARGVEAYRLLWEQLHHALGHRDFNLHVEIER